MKAKFTSRLNSTLGTSTLLLSFLLTGACTPKSVPVNQHAPALRDDGVVASSSRPADMNEFRAVDLSLMETQARGTDVASLRAVVSGLERFVLNANYVEVPRFRDTAEMRRMLGAYNRALLQLAQTENGTERTALDRYAERVLAGCSGDMTGCRNIAFFRADPNSSLILQALARRIDADIESKPRDSRKRLEATRQYYRILGAAFDVKNGSRNQELEFLYLNRAADYATLFEQSLKAQNQGTANAGQGQPGTPTQSQTTATRDLSRDYLDRQTMRRHALVFETILNDFRPDLSDPAFARRFERFVTNFAPWNFSRRRPNPFGDSAGTKMLQLAASNYLYDSSTGQINATLRAAIAESQRVQAPAQVLPSQAPTPLADTCGMESDKSHSQIVADLTRVNGSTFRGLSLRGDFPKDEYFFMVDRLFRQDLTTDDVSKIWQGSRRDERRLIEAMKDYIRIEIAQMIVRTNCFMNTIYREKHRYTSETLVTTTIQRSREISQKWRELVDRIDLLGRFASRQMKRSDTRLQSAEYTRMEAMFDSVRRNLKYLTVFPNMMMMTYFMIEANAKFEVQTPFGKFSVDPSSTIESFFGGRALPFFNFGNDGEPVNKLEMLYTFYFSLKTDTFRAFTVEGGRPIDERAFFNIVINKYLEKERRDLESDLDKLSQNFQRSSTHQNFLAVCEADRGEDANGRAGRARLTIGLEEMTQHAYMGSFSHGWALSAFNFYGNDKVGDNLKVVETVRNLRVSGLDRKLLFVNAIISILDQHLTLTPEMEPDAEKRRKSDEERRALIAAIRGDLAPAENARREYLTEVIRRQLEVGECLMQTIRIEKERQFRVYKMEEEYFKRVHALMKRLQSAPAAQLAQAEAAANEELLNLAPILRADDPSDRGIAVPQGFRGFNRINAREFTMGELDSVLRIRQHLKRVAPTMQVTLPPDLEKTAFYTNAKRATVLFVDDEARFVSNAMRNYNGSQNSFLFWAKQTGAAGWMIRRLELMTELYKLGQMELYDWRSSACRDRRTSSCPVRREKFRVTGDVLVGELFRIARTIDLGPAGSQEREILRLLDLPRRYALAETQKLFLEAGSLRPLTIAENLYRNIVEDNSGLEGSREFYTSDRNVGTFLFAPEATVSELLRRTYRPLAIESIRAALEFERAIQARETKDCEAVRCDVPGGNSVAPIVYEDSGAGELALAGTPPGEKPVYLNRSKTADYATKLQIFHRQTENMFRPADGEIEALIRVVSPQSAPAAQAAGATPGGAPQ